MEDRRQITSWNTQTCAGARRTDKQAAAMISPSSLPVSNNNSIVISGASVCLALRPSVRRSLPQTQPSSAQHRPAPPPCPQSVCHELPRFVPSKASTTRRREQRKERRKKKGMREMGERKRYSQSSNRPLRCSLSPVPTLCICRSIRAAPSCCRCSMTSSSTRRTPSLPVRSFEIKQSEEKMFTSTLK